MRLFEEDKIKATCNIYQERRRSDFHGQAHKFESDLFI